MYLNPHHRPRFQARTNKRAFQQRMPAIGFGVRAGYWPCLLAPYLQIAVHKRRNGTLY